LIASASSTKQTAILSHQSGSREFWFPVNAAISPYREAREWAREEIGNFVEVYVKCPLEVCEERDVKGLYRLVKEGKKKEFTGKDDPYEEPEHPDLVVETDRETVAESVDRILAKLVELEYLSAAAVR